MSSEELRRAKMCLDAIRLQAKIDLNSNYGAKLDFSEEMMHDRYLIARRTTLIAEEQELRKKWVYGYT